MNGLLAVILTAIYIGIVAYMVIKKYNSVFVFLMSGLGVILAFALMGTDILGDATTGNLIIDAFTFVKNCFTKNLSGVGFTLMIITGYAMYMTEIGASTKLAFLAMKPLSKIKSPYVVVSFLLVIGCLLKLVITSASGLGMLLMSIAFPILVSLGISKLSAASLVVLSSIMDWGPNDSSAVFAAEKVCEMPMMEYFIKYQGVVGVGLIVMLAIFLPLYLKRMDAKYSVKEGTGTETPKVEDPSCPGWYAILPIVPLALVTIFSFIDTIKLDVATANVLSLCVALLVELIRRKDKKGAMNDISFVFTKMGTCCANIVSILIAAAVFAQAVKLLNGVTVLSNFLASINSAPIITVAAMSLITFFTGMILGSGNAAWYAFGPLVPDVAGTLGVMPAVVAVPMQLAPAIGRSMSPVAGVMIAVAGMAGVDLQDLIKRNSIPVFVTFVFDILISYGVTMFM